MLSVDLPLIRSEVVVAGLGRLHKVSNLDKKTGANREYWRVLLVSESGSPETLLMTEKELDRCRHRVTMNPEDEVQPTLWNKMAIFFAG